MFRGPWGATTGCARGMGMFGWIGTAKFGPKALAGGFGGGAPPACAAAFCAAATAGAGTSAYGSPILTPIGLVCPQRTVRARQRHSSTAVLARREPTLAFVVHHPAHIVVPVVREPLGQLRLSCFFHSHVRVVLPTLQKPLVAESRCTTPVRLSIAQLVPRQRVSTARTSAVEGVASGSVVSCKCGGNGK